MTPDTFQTTGQADLVLWGGDVEVRRRASGRLGDILTALARAKRNAVLYSADHPFMATTMDEVHAVIDGLLGRRSSLRLSIHEDTFFAENTLLLEESLRYYGLLAELREREIGTLEFLAGVQAWEIARLVEALNMKTADLRGLGGAAALLQHHGVHHILVGPPRPLSAEDHAGLKVDPRDAYRAGLRVVDELNFEAARDLPLEMRKAKLVLKSLIDLVTADRVSLLSVAALKGYDEDTFHHCVNVSILSLMLGARLELDRVLMVTLGLAALLHDIGKVRIPPGIVTKPGTLTPEELEIIRRHPVHGAHLLGNLSGLARLAMVVAFEHHANFNLSGYPRIMAKGVPHLLTRIVHVADVYDAMTSSRRLYRRPMLPWEAMRVILDGAGKVFDPTLARLFVQVLGLYPVGSVVELDTGELGVVLRPGEREVTRPLVKVARGAAWEPIDPYIMNLEEERERRIARALDPVEAEIEVSDYL